MSEEEESLTGTQDKKENKTIKLEVGDCNSFLNMQF
jgi:hypothetical protein